MNRSAIRLTSAFAMLSALATTGGAALVRADTPGVVYVAVAKGDEPVHGLAAKDFEILIGGKPQKVLAAEPASEPLSIVIFVQTRADNTGNRPAETPLTRTAIKNLLAQIRQVNPEARVGLVTTASPPTFVGVTSQAVLLDRQLGTLYADPNIGSIVERIPELTRVLSQEPNARRVILTITPPGVTHGVQLSKETAPSLQRCGCELWSLIVADVGGTLLDRDEILSNLITVSGGRRANVFGTSLLDARARLMVGLLLAQYKVSFERPDSKEPLTLRVGVRTHQTGLEVYAPGWTLN